MPSREKLGDSYSTNISLDFVGRLTGVSADFLGLSEHTPVTPSEIVYMDQ
jgi:hypothetical protein